MLYIKTQGCVDLPQQHNQKFEIKRYMEIELYLNSLRFWYILFCIIVLLVAYEHIQLSFEHLAIFASFSLIYSIYCLLRPVVPNPKRSLFSKVNSLDFIFIGFLVYFTGGLESFFILALIFPLLGSLIRFGTNGGMLGLLIIALILLLMHFLNISAGVVVPFYLELSANLGNLLFAFWVVAVQVKKEEVLRREIYRSSITDALTGLYNAAYLKERVAEEVFYCCRREEGTFTLIFIDLNGFKAINDTYGHLVGDKVLVHVAKTLKENIRKEETLARYGGDEFILFLPGANHEEAEQAAQRLGQSVKQNSYLWKGVNIGPVLSIGTATYPADGHDLEELLLTADRRMYKEKQQYKNEAEAKKINILATAISASNSED